MSYVWDFVLVWDLSSPFARFRLCLCSGQVFKGYVLLTPTFFMYVLSMTHTGFGRIGRLVCRAAMKNPNVVVKAVNVSK